MLTGNNTRGFTFEQAVKQKEVTSLTLAVSSCEAKDALALVLVDLIVTERFILARGRRTFVDVFYKMMLCHVF